MTVIGAIVTLLLGSTVIAAVLDYFSEKSFNERNHEVKYITSERENWRKDIKEKTSIFCSTEDIKEQQKAKTFLTLSLNPRDTDDQEIVDCLNDILNDAINKQRTEEKEPKVKKEKIEKAKIKDARIKNLESLVAFLLKHDWERLKKDMNVEYRDVDRKRKHISTIQVPLKKSSRK